MLGASHRGAYEGDQTGVVREYIPFGDIGYSPKELYRLRSTTLDIARSRVLSPREAARLSATPACEVDPIRRFEGECLNNNGGESIGVLFTAYLRQRIIALRGGWATCSSWIVRSRVRPSLP